MLPICQKCKSLLQVNAQRKHNLAGFWKLGISLPWGQLRLQLDYNMYEGPMPCVSVARSQASVATGKQMFHWCVHTLGEGDWAPWAVLWGCSPPTLQGLRSSLPLQLPVLVPTQERPPGPGHQLLGAQLVTWASVRWWRCFNKTRQPLWLKGCPYPRGCSRFLPCSWLSSSLSL